MFLDRFTVHVICLSCAPIFPHEPRKRHSFLKTQVFPHQDSNFVHIYNPKNQEKEAFSMGFIWF